MKCDYTRKLPSTQEWESLDRRRKRIREKKDAAMREILRFNKEEELLDQKEKKMIERGISTLDELDALGNSEELLVEQGVEEAVEEALGESNLQEIEALLAYPPIDLIDVNDLPESFWLRLASPSACVQA